MGAGVYADQLMDVLLGLDMKGLPDSEYVFLNAETGVYLYHEDDSLLNTVAEDSGYQEIIRRVKADGNTRAGTYSYQDQKGVDQLVVYKYLKDRNWVFMIRDSESEVYAAVKKVRILVGMLCAAVAAAIILITIPYPVSSGKGIDGCGRCHWASGQF